MKTTKKEPKWFRPLLDLLGECWEHHGPCNHIFSRCEWDDEHGEWVVCVAPVFQEVFGGEDDGKKVWTGFIFDAAAFYAAAGVHVESFAAGSYCTECSPTPRLMFKCKYRGHKIYLQILLEPPPNANAVEIIDTIHKKILDKPEVKKTNDDHGTNTNSHS